uniref:Uncharacterized protein n=1 Tax=Ditylenchus dipsaci TaxID=166011 RepID=A0A915EQZ0_9BILA
MGQSISKYSTFHKELQLPSLMVEIFSDHYIDRLEALDTDVYLNEEIDLWPRSPDGEHYVPFVFATNNFSARKILISGWTKMEDDGYVIARGDKRFLPTAAISSHEGK